MWAAPNDPQIFGVLDVDARPVQRFIRHAQAAGHRVTPTHVVGRALAHALVAVPDLNVRLRRGRAVPRSSVDIFFVTAVAGGNDLSGVKVRDVPARSAIDVASELTERAGAMKAGRDRDFAKTKRLLDRTPPSVLRGVLRVASFLADDLGLDLPVLALRKNPFGSAMVTSVGMFGLPSGFAPLAWMYDVPVLVVVGEIALKPVVDAGKVEVCPMLPLTATIDHRYVDGWHVSRAMTAFREYLAAPERFEPVIGLHAA
jgi:pyruvate/2-oxoglutarate dehydrogenase complex dihydrolipoamide acyltransferase (E2) component